MDVPKEEWIDCSRALLGWYGGRGGSAGRGAHDMAGRDGLGNGHGVVLHETGPGRGGLERRWEDWDGRW